MELTQEGIGKLFCLAGIGGQIKGVVKSVKYMDMEVLSLLMAVRPDVPRRPLSVMKSFLKNYLVLTELGIEKNVSLALNTDDVEKVKQAVRK